MTTLETLNSAVKSANTTIEEGRQIIANSCKQLYNIIENGLYEKYGDEAMVDAHKDLCKGNFAEPFMCEQKKSKFELYYTIYITKIA